jgi:hypothetical protein
LFFSNIIFRSLLERRAPQCINLLQSSTSKHQISILFLFFSPQTLQRKRLGFFSVISPVSLGCFSEMQFLPLRPETDVHANVMVNSSCAEHSWENTKRWLQEQWSCIIHVSLESFPNRISYRKIMQSSWLPCKIGPRFTIYIGGRADK